jgi:predicted AlkP superfamily phosphohydrolase/phosphomutase
MVERSRVVAIGLDGLPLDLIQPWIDAGELPFLKEYSKNGILGRLKTVFPPVTATAWSSINTGKNPGKHGIFEFLQRVPGEKERQAVNSTFIDGETIWDVLSRQGRRVCVVNVPVTFPPRPVNGILISGFLTPRGNRDFTWPPSLLREMEERFGTYQLYHHEVYRAGGVQKVIDELNFMLDFRGRTGLHLLQSEAWDFFIINFLGTDRVQHELWHIWDESHHLHSPRESGRYREKIMDFFRSLDKTLEEFSRAAGPETHMMLFSDHGMGILEYFVNFNTWLMEKGYLKLKRTPPTALKKALFFGGFTPAFTYRMAMYCGMAKLRLKGGLGQRRKVIDLMRRIFLSMDNVDWKKTVAYSQGNYGQIFINLQGREPEGVVSRGEEYERILAGLKKDLEEMVDPRNGQRLVDEVFRREDIYSGPHTEMAPDISFSMRDMRYKALGVMEFSSRHFVEKAFGNSGDHRMHGLLALKGKGVKGEFPDIEARVTDIMPTILYLLGVPIPDDLDGRVLTELFESQFIQEREVSFSAAVQNGSSEGSRLDETENRDIQERLKNLGYLG